MRKKIAAVLLAGGFALSVPAAAMADNPHAGKSGHFKGSAGPCPQNEQQCPPQND